MKVTLLSFTENPDINIAMAANLCHTNGAVENIMQKYSNENNVEFLIKYLFKHNHLSPEEFSFEIEHFITNEIGKVNFKFSTLNYFDMLQ